MAFTTNSTSLAMLAPQAFTIVGFGFGFGGSGAATESESGAVYRFESINARKCLARGYIFNSRLYICVAILTQRHSAGKDTSWRRVAT